MKENLLHRRRWLTATGLLLVAGVLTAAAGCTAGSGTCGSADGATAQKVSTDSYNISISGSFSTTAFYNVTDGDGNVLYSDKPTSSSEIIFPLNHAPGTITLYVENSDCGQDVGDVEVTLPQ